MFPDCVSLFFLLVSYLCLITYLSICFFSIFLFSSIFFSLNPFSFLFFLFSFLSLLLHHLPYPLILMTNCNGPNPSIISRGIFNLEWNQICVFMFKETLTIRAQSVIQSMTFILEKPQSVTNPLDS